MNDKLSRELRKAIQRNSLLQRIPVTIVSAASMPGFTTVAFSNDQEMDVVNFSLSNIPGMKAAIGYDPLRPGILQLLSTRDTFGDGGELVPYSIIDHHSNHEWPGHDTVWVKGEQFVPLNVLPSGGYLLQFYGAVIFESGVWVKAPNAPIDLVASLPTTGARYVLIEIDVTGAVSLIDGGVADSKDLLTVDSIPAPTVGNCPVAAVRMYEGQVDIRRDRQVNDFVDLRWSGAFFGGYYVHPNHSGDVTSVGDGAQTIANNAVTNTKILNATIVATAKLSATGTPSATTFLRGDDTWATPAGGSGGDRRYSWIGI